MDTGVYTITNLINGKIYVGSSRNSLKRREYSHFYYLGKNAHDNQRLQNSYNKYGKDNFKFEVLEFHEKEYCLYMEQYWMNMLKSYNTKHGYNIVQVSFNSKLGGLISDELRRKRAICCAKTHKGAIRSEEVKKKISESLKGHSYNKGIKKSQIHKDKLRQASINYAKHNRVGACKYVYQYDLDLKLIKIYNSLKECTSELNINKTTILSIHKGKTKNPRLGYIFKIKKEKDEQI